MRLSPASFLALLPVFLSACATHPLDVQRDFDPKFNFAHIKTFDFAGGTLETEAAKKTAERLHLDALLGSEIKRQMEQRGYRQSSSQPDVRIAYSFGEWALDSHKKPNGGYGAVGIMFPGAHGSLLPEGSDGRVPPPSENPYTSQYEEARLEILMVDPTSGKIIWNAGIKDKHDFGYFRSSQPAQIEKGVVTILEGFPPGSANPR
jgi:Domain of unknown function (DUF4136)